MHITRILVPLLLITACTDNMLPPSAEEQLETRSVLDTLQTINTQSLHDAFILGSSLPHRRHLMAQRRDGRGLRMHEQLVQISGDGELRVIHGPDDENAEESGDLAALDSLIMPEEPAYLNPRFRDEFEFRILPDTPYWDRPVLVIEVAARAGSKQDLRRVRYYVDRATGTLVDYRLERNSAQILYGERSHFILSLRPGPDNAWVPHQVGIAVTMHLPPRRTRMIKREVTFYDYDS